MKDAIILWLSVALMCFVGILTASLSINYYAEADLFKAQEKLVAAQEKNTNLAVDNTLNQARQIVNAWNQQQATKDKK